MYPQSVQLTSVPPAVLASVGRKVVEKKTRSTPLRTEEMLKVEARGQRPDRGRREGDSRGAACVERRIWRGRKVSTVTTPTVTTSPS